MKGFSNILQDHWRGWAAIVYLAICIFDFILALIWFNIGVAEYIEELSKINLELAKEALQQTSRWMPLTLSNGGLFHLSFGAILGVTAFNRQVKFETQVKQND